MKKQFALLAFSALVFVVSVSARAEVMKNKCQWSLDAQDGLVALTNDITAHEGPSNVFPLDCLKVSKKVLKAKLNGQLVRGVKIIYLNRESD